MKKLLMWALIYVGLRVFANTPCIQISNLHVQQRYPWNGKVDITFEINGCDSDTSGSFTLCVSPLVNEPAFDSNWIKSVTVDGTLQELYSNSTREYPLPHLVGRHHVVWDSDQDRSPLLSTHLLFQIGIHTALKPPTDAVGAPLGIVKDLVVLNLEDLMSETPTANSIQVFPSRDVGCFNCDTYKTAKMAFVKVHKGIYHVGPEDVANLMVAFTKDYYFGMHQVTRQHYQTVVGEDPSTSASSELMSPVRNVTWDVINRANTGFLARANAKIQQVGASFQIQLPTEAQWEVASRAKTLTKWFFGSTGAELQTYAWCRADNSTSGWTGKVGTKRSNQWGLYDVYGNVWEWCSSWYNDNVSNYSGQDPQGAGSGSTRVQRGGRSDYGADKCNSAYRNSFAPASTYWGIGFRCALEPRPLQSP